MTIRHGWLLDETTSAGRENYDPEHAVRYDTKEDADAEAEVRLVADLGIPPDSTVIDVGAGTGQFTLAASRAFSRIIAVDVSPVMLGVLRSRIRAERVMNVEVIEAGFLTYEHAGAPADLVYTRYALHHLPDFWKALALHRLRRALRSGGVLRLWDVVYSFEPAESPARLDEWCESIDAEGLDGWSRADLVEHIRDEHSTFSWLLEPMLERAGFRIEETTYSPEGIFARYIARAV